MYDEKGIYKKFIEGTGDVNMFDQIKANLFNLVTCDDDLECANIMEALFGYINGLEFKMTDLAKERDIYRHQAVTEEVKRRKVEAELEAFKGKEYMNK